MNNKVLDLGPYVPLINEVVCLHSCNLMERYLGAEPAVQILNVPEEKKPLYHHGFEVSGFGEEIRETMLDNPLAPLFVSFSILDNELNLGFGILLGDTAKVVFKLKGQSLEALAEAQFRMFLMREEEQFNRVGLKRDEFFLTFKEMVEMMEPTPRISFYLLMNQENLGDISPQ
jgi:hypothetical protein